MVLCFTEIPDPKFPFFSTLTKFQQCIFRRIHWILTFPNGPTKAAVHRCLTLEVYSALIEYENEKVKPAHYLVQLLIAMIPMINDKIGFMEIRCI